jgi:hypothetical protein
VEKVAGNEQSRLLNYFSGWQYILISGVLPARGRGMSAAIAKKFQTTIVLINVGS